MAAIVDDCERAAVKAVVDGSQDAVGLKFSECYYERNPSIRQLTEALQTV